MDALRSGYLARRVWLFQLGKFITVGVINTLVDLGVFFLLLQTTELAGNPVLAKAISYACGILNSFFWNRAWTFRSRIAIAPGLALFVFANLGALVVNAGGMYIGLNVLNLPRIFALTVATVSTFLLNFVVSKFVIFRS